ncbi:hypothetical protein B0J17DRAFT_575579, partial [Rhizoctonia solani]
CIYQTSATATCSQSSVCGFTCSNGLTKVRSSCQCVAPKTMCNGVSTSAACLTGSLSGHGVGLVRTWMVYPSGMERCGVLRSSSDRAYECLNTQRDLESFEIKTVCFLSGGCATPIAGEEATGKDCTAIPGVSDVECIAVKCNVV